MAYYENDPRRNGSEQNDRYDQAYQQYQQQRYQQAQAGAAGYAESPYLSLSQYMARTFGWMFAGLMLTFAVALATVISGAFVALWNTGLVFALSIGELILVAVLSMRVQKIQPATATAMFFAYAALTGINLSVYFVVYDLSTLILQRVSSIITSDCSSRSLSMSAAFSSMNTAVCRRVSPLVRRLVNSCFTSFKLCSASTISWMSAPPKRSRLRRLAF